MSENSGVPNSRLAAYKNYSKNSQVSRLLDLFPIVIAHCSFIRLKEMRQRRQEVNVELRKNKKEDQMLKRRNIAAEEPSSPLQESNGQSVNLAPMTLDEIMDLLESKNPIKQFNAVQGVRKMLSRERNPPIDTVINIGLVPILINFLDDASK